METRTVSQKSVNQSLRLSAWINDISHQLEELFFNVLRRCMITSYGAFIYLFLMRGTVLLTAADKWKSAANVLGASFIAFASNLVVLQHSAGHVTSTLWHP